MNRKIALCLKLLVATSLLGYLFASGKIDLSKLGRIESWGWIALGQVCVFLLISATFVRWHLLLRAQEIDYSLRESYTLGFIGFFFNQFVPGSTGGDFVKAYYVASEHPERRVPGVVSVFLDRILGIVILMTVCACASLVYFDTVRQDGQLLTLAVTIFIVLAGVAVTTLLFFNDRVRQSKLISRLTERLPFRSTLASANAAVYIYKHHARIGLAAFALTVLVHLLLGSAAICYALALGDSDAPLGLFFFIVPLANLAMALPLSPGGLGVGEFAFIELFKKIGYANGDAIAVLHRMSYMLWALVGLVLYLLRRRSVDRALALARANEGGEKDARSHESTGDAASGEDEAASRSELDVSARSV